MTPPPGYQRATELLAQGELADAIGAFLGALEEEPEHLDSYFGLMKTYELSFEVLPDPELLHQVGNVLMGLRDRELDEATIRRANEVEARVLARLEEIGHPPPAPGRTSPG